MSTVKTVVSWVLFLVGLYFIAIAVAATASVALGLSLPGLPTLFRAEVGVMAGLSLGIHAAIGAGLIYASRMSYFKH
jgi:hypothetical protein